MRPLFNNKIKSLVFFALFLCVVHTGTARAQELPDKIRGYKVQKVEISVNRSDTKEGFSVQLDYSDPKPKSVSLTGFTISLESGVLVSGHSGTVEFITFRDFSVNGIKVDIAEYNDGFDFEKDERVELKKPIEIFIGSGQALKGAYRELRESRKQWCVRGRVFVFGKFKKFGFKFKRVVPVNIEFLIPNPLLNSTPVVEPDSNIGCNAGVV